MQEEFDFEDDKVFLYIPSAATTTHPYPVINKEGHLYISKKQLVMTKDLFKECYKRWILEESKE